MDSLASMCQSLPRTSAAAQQNRATIFRDLTPVFRTWYSLVLLPALRAGGNASKHSEREGCTLVESCDLLLKGETLTALVAMIGRLKALTSVVIPEGQTGGWNTAQHFEVVSSSQTGLLTQRDRTNALRDQRDALRAQGLAPRRGDGAANS